MQVENAPKIRESIASGRVDALSMVHPQSENARGRGPRAALVASGIGKMSRCARDRWLEDARLEALLGNRKATLTSLKSGVKCYISFVGKVCAACHVHDMFQHLSFCRRLRQKVCQVLSSESGYSPRMVDLISIKRYIFQLSWLCEDRVPLCSCPSGGKYLLSCC